MSVPINNSGITPSKGLYQETVVIIDTLLETIKLRDMSTAEHSLLMAKYNYKIAQRFDPSRAKMYYLAGLVHDIGKISMSDDILKGSFVLDPKDRFRVHGHVINGVRLLFNLKLPPLIVNVAKYHHERYDGSGYCEGLKGIQIPLEGRISAVADTYSTLIGGRRYMNPKSPEQALEIMIKEDKLFDPEILCWFVNFIGEEMMTKAAR